jgi:imidazolonepropionase-like amidohydrolase
MEINTALPNRSGRLVAGGYFDGDKAHSEGPFAFTLRAGRIAAIAPAAVSEPVTCEFLLPALADCHVHCFLDGSLTDDGLRRQHRARGFEALFSTGLANTQAAWERGISLLRDAGDPYGVNDAVRERLRGAAAPGDLEGARLKLRSPSFALHRPGRYGAFLARAVEDDREIVPLVRQLARHADEIKVLLTGPIDFLARAVRGKPQFALDAARTIVATAREMGKTAFAHANGPQGVALAIAAGFASVEHGYFLDDDCLRALADHGVAWTPTLAPVMAQRELARQRGEAALVAALDDILARHAERMARAAQLGVPLLCGSDAGSPGVPHGEGPLQELAAWCAAGVPVEIALRGATTLPRQRWGEPGRRLAPGEWLDAAALAGNPFHAPQALLTARRVRG